VVHIRGFLSRWDEQQATAARPVSGSCNNVVARRFSRTRVVGRYTYYYAVRRRPRQTVRNDFNRIYDYFFVYSTLFFMLMNMVFYVLYHFYRYAWHLYSRLGLRVTTSPDTPGRVRQSYYHRWWGGRRDEKRKIQLINSILDLSARRPLNRSLLLIAPGHSIRWLPLFVGPSLKRFARGRQIPNGRTSEFMMCVLRGLYIIIIWHIILYKVCYYYNILFIVCSVAALSGRLSKSYNMFIKIFIFNFWIISTLRLRNKFFLDEYHIMYAVPI